MKKGGGRDGRETVDLIYSDGMWMPSPVSRPTGVRPSTVASTRRANALSNSSFTTTVTSPSASFAKKRATTPSQSGTAVYRSLEDISTTAPSGSFRAYDERTVEAFERGLSAKLQLSSKKSDRHNLRPISATSVQRTSSSVENFMKIARAERKKSFTTIPKSKIPKNFYITEETTAPIVDAHLHTVYDADKGVYKRIIFPTKKPSSTREEVGYVRKVLADMLGRFVKTKGTEKVADVGRDVLKIYSIIINEIVRQEAMQSLDRAHLLNDVWNDCMTLFEQLLASKNVLEQELVEVTARVEPIEREIELERSRRQDAEREKEELEQDIKIEREQAIKGNGLYGEGGLLHLARSGQSKVRNLEIELGAQKSAAAEKEQALKTEINRLKAEIAQLKESQKQQAKKK